MENRNTFVLKEYVFMKITPYPTLFKWFIEGIAKNKYKYCHQLAFACGVLCQSLCDCEWWEGPCWDDGNEKGGFGGTVIPNCTEAHKDFTEFPMFEDNTVTWTDTAQLLTWNYVDLIT